ncbi:MAG: hypothetical protein P0Y53_07700 [Candidatus Pseudobacter hemicellulosilyticus]|uniref:Uncharacterized protein n=1 Tax=Candidatus Pseudobacter hemicellulosilyticus TaxID=3121375 RepID=A0AAJ5WUI5_9BACT|nr:MAG: hypothetical protein P0Y53_07700 [Pseudobacter sp.]
MRTARQLFLVVFSFFLLTGGSSCKVWNNLFGPKYGCPGSGKNMGAERLMSGEKVPKAKKFRS